MQLVDSTFSYNFCVAFDRLTFGVFIISICEQNQLQVCDDRFYCTVFILSCLSSQ